MGPKSMSTAPQGLRMRISKSRLSMVIAFLVFSLMLPRLHAQSGIEPYDIERAGLSGWQFLKIHGDARLASMAGAYTATSHGDAGAIFGNPSALVDVQNLGVNFTNFTWIADIGYMSVTIAKRLGSMGVVGLSVTSVDMGEMDETINSPVAGENRTDVIITGKTFTAGDIAAGLSYAKRVTDRLALGGNIRWIQETIADVSMTNFSVDFGTTYYTGFKSLRLAMVARNFGPDQHLVGWSEKYQAEAVDIRMPLDFRVGMAMDFLGGETSPHLLTLSVEGTHPNDGPEKIHVGTEYWYNNMLAIRSGYRANYDEEDITLGGGLRYSISGLMLRVDYGYIAFGRLGQVHMFTLGASFE
ncbi:hypothetical protein AMJ86_09210 [bacterium SM23_57]|nr:MAG: hypothetical protein AMJ86_09210 [bacterium SM23_57]